MAIMATSNLLGAATYAARVRHYILLIDTLIPAYGLSTNKEDIGKTG